MAYGATRFGRGDSKADHMALPELQFLHLKPTDHLASLIAQCHADTFHFYREFLTTTAPTLAEMIEKVEKYISTNKPVHEIVEGKSVLQKWVIEWALVDDSMRVPYTVEYAVVCAKRKSGDLFRPHCFRTLREGQDIDTIAKSIAAAKF